MSRVCTCSVNSLCKTDVIDTDFRSTGDYLPFHGLQQSDYISLLFLLSLQVTKGREGDLVLVVHRWQQWVTLPLFLTLLSRHTVFFSQPSLHIKKVKITANFFAQVGTFSSRARCVKSAQGQNPYLLTSVHVFVSTFYAITTLQKKISLCVV